MALPAKKGTIMQKRKIRIGIDVGGTFTHAVALEHQSYQVIAHAVTPTTHSSQYSVSEGIIKTFQDVLQQTGAAPEDVVFVAHSTTRLQTPCWRATLQKWASSAWAAVWRA